MAIRNDIADHCQQIGMQCPKDGLPNEILLAFNSYCSQEQQSSEALIRETVRNPSVIMQEISDIETEQKALGSTSKLEQFKNAFVIAATFDSAIGHLPMSENTQPYSHAFIDEAGYVSLARGLTAFSCGCPVSFFGDHFQLPPICEMNENQIKGEHPEVSLWSVPVVAYSDLVGYGLGHIVSLLDRQDYRFDRLKYTQLLKTYRFGPELAEVLDSQVYHTHGKFIGAAQTSFEILVLHGAKRSTDNKLESAEEAAVIRSFLEKTHPDDGTYVILAPYKMQIKQLKKLMPQERSNILTVHRAQGMEWDTVILSVCDTKDAYFMDSSRKKGKCVLNTAISRAKKRLVIACDTDFWRMEHRQLIGQLIAKQFSDRRIR